MNTSKRILFPILISAIASVSAFSQSTISKTEKKIQPSTSQKEATRSTGLKRITTRPSHDWNFDIHIDQKALEANIESAIEKAMKSVDVALEAIEIHIDPIEINLKDLNVDIDPIRIDISNINVDIEPIEIDLSDMDIDVDVDHDNFSWNEDRDNEDNDDEYGNAFRKEESDSSKSQDKDKNKEKDKLKDKSDKKDKPEKAAKKDWSI